MADDRRTYRLEQLGRPRSNGVQQNEEVASLEALVTHHPGANRNIRMQGGEVMRAENPARRSHAYISGDFEEVIDNRVDRYGTLKPAQVLLVKDFILEDPSPRPGTSARAVDVPSPTDGYVNSVRPAGGFVEIMDREGGAVVARLRHLSNITVERGDTVGYGQSLGRQDNLGLNRPAGIGVHVHLEMDTGHYQQLRNYMADLAGGRLPVQAQYRENVQPLPVADDGTLRLGQSSDRIRDLQRVMASEGHRSADGSPLAQDGVYRMSMQGAVLDFQRAHGVPQTGDIDAATLRMAPSSPQRQVDRDGTVYPGQPAPHAVPDTRAPGHPEHPDHRRNLTDPLPPPVNQSGRAQRAGLDEADERLLDRLRLQVRDLDQQVGKGWDDNSERLAAAALVMARERGFTADDDVRLDFNRASEKHAAGELLHMARLGANESPDPAANRASMPTMDALSKAPELRYEQAAAIGQAQAQAQQFAQQQDLARVNDPAQRGPTMSM
jgi:hypothetical protein